MLVPMVKSQRYGSMLNAMLWEKEQVEDLRHAFVKSDGRRLAGVGHAGRMKPCLLPCHSYLRAPCSVSARERQDHELLTRFLHSGDETVRT